MPKGYTSNQTGAIACLLALCVWSTTVYAVNWIIGQASILYSIFIIIAWILLPLYIKLIDHAFIVGIFLSAGAMCYLLITSSILATVPWYTFTQPLYHLTWVLFYLIDLAFIYFSYKSYWESFQKLAQLLKDYTINQTGAIACLLASVMWGLTIFGATYIITESSPNPVYIIILAIGWSLLPFYIKLFRRAFIVGIYLLIISMLYLFITPSLQGTPLWYIFSRGLLDFTYVLFYVISFVGVYFHYKSWKELFPK